MALSTLRLALTRLMRNNHTKRTRSIWGGLFLFALLSATVRICGVLSVVFVALKNIGLVRAKVGESKRERNIRFEAVFKRLQGHGRGVRQTYCLGRGGAVRGW
jgi:hypothetical protein